MTTTGDRRSGKFGCSSHGKERDARSGVHKEKIRWVGEKTRFSVSGCWCCRASCRAPLCERSTNQEVSQQSDGTEHEGEELAGQQQPARYFVAGGITSFPSADEEVEGEVVHPPGEHQPAAAKELYHAIEGLKAALGVASMGDHDREITDREQERERPAGNPRGGEFVVGEDHQQEPTGEDGGVCDGEDGFRCHGFHRDIRKDVMGRGCCEGPESDIQLPMILREPGMFPRLDISMSGWERRISRFAKALIAWAIPRCPSRVTALPNSVDMETLALCGSVQRNQAIVVRTAHSARLVQVVLEGLLNGSARMACQRRIPKRAR